MTRHVALRKEEHGEGKKRQKGEGVHHREGCQEHVVKLCIKWGKKMKHWIGMIISQDGKTLERGQNEEKEKTA